MKTFPVLKSQAFFLLDSWVIVLGRFCFFYPITLPPALSICLWTQLAVNISFKMHLVLHLLTNSLDIFSQHIYINPWNVLYLACALLGDMAILWRFGDLSTFFYKNESCTYRRDNLIVTSQSFYHGYGVATRWCENTFELRSVSRSSSEGSYS